MKKIFKTWAVFFLLISALLPFFTLAEGLVPCDTDCHFTSLIKMINNIIDFILFKMAVPIAAIMFAYAGFMLITSGGEAGKRTKAKEIFLNVAIGLIFVAACWLIVHTLASIVGYKGSWIGV